jgi:methionyl-tRNA formyltransferase
MKPLRALVITESDPIYVIEFFEEFLRELPRDGIDVAAIAICRAFHEPLHRTARRMLSFYGAIDFARLLTRWIGAKLRRRSIANLARNAGLRVIEAGSVNEEAFLQEARAIDPDVIVSVAAPEIFKKPLLSLARLGAINIHSGRLPRYRGMMPTFWQLLHGESHVTVTIHRMVERLDAGEIVSEERFPLEARDSLDRVIVGTKRLGGRMMIRTLLELESLLAKARLPAGEPGYFRFPAPADVRAFRRKGHRMLGGAR